MAAAAIEQQAPREAVRTLERLVYHEGLVGLHARLLLSGDAVNPHNTQIPAVARQLLRSLPERAIEPQGTYVLANRASTAERKDWWEKQGVEGFDAQKKAWIDRTVATFAQAQEFFEKSGKGQQWKRVFARFPARLTRHIDTAHFGTQEAGDLYEEYFTGAKKNAAVQNFVNDILLSYRSGEGTIDYQTLHQDLPALQWLSGIFGERSKEIVAQLTDAEAIAMARPDELIAAANTQETTTDNQQVLRMNNLREKEIELLTFLWGDDSKTQPTQRREITPLPEESLKNIIEGRGFAEIERVGWPSYREALTHVPYSQIFDHQLREAVRLREQARENPQEIQKEELKQLNTNAKQRAEKLADELPIEYSRDKDNPFVCIETGSGKLSMRGKEYHGGDIPHTRLYLATYTHNAPEAYLSLFEALRDENALDTINLSLNLENFPQSDAGMAQDNTIILYMTEFTPETMRKVATAMRKAKEAHPEYWQMSPNDAARMREVLVHNFKIPLDDTTGFVEMANGDSYDTRDRLVIGREFDPSYNHPSSDFAQGLQTLASRIKLYTPDTPGRFTSEAPSMKRRRKYMPGILFNEVAFAHPDWEKLKAGYSEDGWQQITAIRNHVTSSEVIKKGLPVYYPGSGGDVDAPLADSDADKFVFVDYNYVDENKQPWSFYTSIAENIEQLGGKIISDEVQGVLGEGGKRVITFDWGGRQRTLILYAEDATKFTPEETKDGIAFTFIKAPTATGRTADNSDKPGNILSLEGKESLYKNLTIGGFYNVPPVWSLPPEAVGFRKLISPDIYYTSDSGIEYRHDGLFQKVKDVPSIPAILEVDIEVLQAVDTRKGLATNRVDQEALQQFGHYVTRAREGFLKLSSEQQEELLPAMRDILTPQRLTNEEKEAMLRFGRGSGITDEEKALAYLQQANEVALKVFPELQEATT